MKYSLVLFGCSAALVVFVPPASAKSAAEIEAVARSVSVEMISSVGSGVLVHRQGDLYTVITNRHVVCVEKKLCDESGVRNSYQLKTIDGQVYKVGRSEIKLLKDAGGNRLDLAIVQFRSSHNYAVAQVAEPGNLKVGDVVYTAGFPAGQGFLFGQGKAHAVVNKRLEGDKGGYTVIYDAETLQGMSGGGAFSSEGRLVAIHGQGDIFTHNTEASSSLVKNEVGSKIGSNRGIPIRWVVQGLGERGIVVGNRGLPRAVQEEAVVAATADEFFIAGFNKAVEPGEDMRAGREEAVQQLSRAIALKPKYTTAYYVRAIINDLLGNYPSALVDFNQVIALDPKNANAYNHRGVLKHTKLNDSQGALADYNQVITLDPKLANAYSNRGVLKAEKLNDSQGALADYDQAIALSPRTSTIYNNRGILKYKQLNDLQGALADYDQAITLNPKYAKAYSNRGVLKDEKLRDPQGALADYNQSIILDPKNAEAYLNRGNLKNKLSDHQGSLVDYNQSIALNPKYAEAYYSRGLLKEDKLDNPQGALADYNQAIFLNPDFADAYNNRGILKYLKLNDRPSGISYQFAF
jgi:tetratricopeptide (TPR) repeat protein